MVASSGPPIVYRITICIFTTLGVLITMPPILLTSGFPILLILAIIDSCPNPISVVYKIELKDIPFIKQIAKCMKAFFIDREDVRQSMKVIMAVSKEVEKGRNYIIFPEGTRSKNGNKLGEFKGGSFKAATKAKCPIIPVALIDSFKPFDSHSLKPVEVQVHYLKPLYYNEYKDMKTTEIAEEVKRRIEKVIEEYKKD